MSIRNFFDKSIVKKDEEIESFEIFVYEWIKKAERELKWDKRLIRGLIATGNHLLDKKGTIQTNLPKTMTKSGGEVECNCSSESNWCSIDIMIDCIKGKCDETIWGCGTLLVYPCDGLCNGM